MRHNDQNGFVSIIVASILMVLVSLVVLGFATIMQREQRQALDRQLSTQAFYAAETGVNDVYQQLAAGNLSDPADIEKNTCDVDTDLRWNSGIIDPAAPDVKYTCLIYDQTPGDLVFTDSVNSSTSQVFPIEPEDGNNVDWVSFAWTGTDGSLDIDPSTAGCTGNFPTSYSVTNSVPLLRVDLIAAPTTGFTRDFLINNTASYYFVAGDGCGTDASGTVPFETGVNQGQIEYVDCDTTTGSPTEGCRIRVDLPDPLSNRYYARVKSVYNDVGTLVVQGQTVGGQLEFKNAQTLVDVTGKANDVLRRIEVRVSNNPKYGWPEGVLETSSGFCKTLGVTPPSTVSNYDCY